MNAQEFQRFYQEHVVTVYRFVYSKVGNKEDAEDLTSHIFLKVVSGIDRERSLQSMHKWLFVVARTTIADYWRLRYRLTTNSLDALLEAGWEGPVEEELLAPDESLPERVQGILQALPERYRKVLICRFLLNLSLRDTAASMGITVGTVKILQYRALKRAADLENRVAEQQRIAL